MTFTQETWAHIYKTKDAEHPNKRIVGWYHSHPGFGVFLSDHDTFIQRNFFSDPRQVAWVFDPHPDEEGRFALRDGEIVRLPQIALRDEPPAEISIEMKTRWSEGGTQPELPVRYTGRSEFPEGDSLQDGPSGEPSDGARKAVKWSLMFLSYVLVAILGFLGVHLCSCQRTSSWIRINYRQRTAAAHLLEQAHPAAGEGKGIMDNETGKIRITNDDLKQAALSRQAAADSPAETTGYGSLAQEPVLEQSKPNFF